MLDAILDGLGDILEPIADKMNLDIKVDDEKLRYSYKWFLYLFKILVASFMIGSAFINMFANQSFFYTVNENGILKVLTNLVKLGLALYMLDQFSQKMGEVKKRKLLEVKRSDGKGGIAGLGVAGNGVDDGVLGFGGYYNMFRSKHGIW